MTTPKLPARWRDFAHTAGVRLAGALAAHEAAHKTTVKVLPRAVRQSFTFALLAASTSDVPQLPAGGYDAIEGGLSISTVTEPGQVAVTMRLVGVDALENASGHEARVSSDDGVISRIVRFDDDGVAVCRFDDSEALRAALARLRVDVLADSDT